MNSKRFILVLSLRSYDLLQMKEEKNISHDHQWLIQHELQVLLTLLCKLAAFVQLNSAFYANTAYMNRRKAITQQMWDPCVQWHHPES